MGLTLTVTRILFTLERPMQISQIDKTDSLTSVAIEKYYERNLSKSQMD